MPYASPQPWLVQVQALVTIRDGDVGAGDVAFQAVMLMASFRPILDLDFRPKPYSLSISIHSLSSCPASSSSVPWLYTILSARAIFHSWLD